MRNAWVTVGTASLMLGAMWVQVARVEGQKNAPAAAPVPELFIRTGCTHCHGAMLEGTDKAPSLKGIGSRWTAAKIRTQVHDGGAAMPAFGEVLSADELTSITSYLAAGTLKSTPQR